MRATAAAALAVVAEEAVAVVGVVAGGVVAGAPDGSVEGVVGFDFGRKPGAGASCAKRHDEKSSGSKSAVRRFMVSSLEERRYHSNVMS